MDITLTKIVGYLFGISAILFGLVLLLASVVAGLALIVAGGLALPIVRAQLRDQAGITFSKASVAGIVLVLLATSFGGLVVATVGDGGSSATEPTGPGSDVSNVSVQATDATPNTSTANLDVEWNARAQSAVDPDTSDYSSYSADDGQKYLVVRVGLTNTGNESLDMRPALFRVAVDGVEYEYQALFGSSQGGLSQVTLRPNASYDGWVAFSVPESATDAELIVHQDDYYDIVTVDFKHDESMAINVSD